MKQPSASLGEAPHVIGLAIELLAAMDESYKRSGEAITRKFNLAFFKYVTASGSHVAETTLAEPFGSSRNSNTRRRLTSTPPWTWQESPS
ncbi:MAG: hypothetical protein V3U47_08205 [Acidimicrobiia bacterium]